MTEHEPYKLEIVWTVEDIKSKRPEWTDHKCHEVLYRMSKHIYEKSIEAGWDVIDGTIWMYDNG